MVERKEKKREIKERKERKGENMERKRQEANGLFLSSSAFRRSELVGPRTKASLLIEDYEYIPKLRDFTEDLARDIRDIEVGLRKAS